MAAGDEVGFEAEVASPTAGRLEVIVDGEAVAGPRDPATAPGTTTLGFTFQADGVPHWVRLNVRDQAGRLALIGNPIYLTVPSTA